MSERKLKRFLRKRTLSERYGVNVRTIDRMVKRGHLPPPTIHRGRLPLWDEQVIEENERDAVGKEGRST
jgi:predicted DNA-binding transcriptional regulator AlpA